MAELGMDLDLDLILKASFSIAAILCAYLLVRLAINPIIERTMTRARASRGSISFMKSAIDALVYFMAVVIAISQFGIRLEIVYVFFGVILIGLMFGFKDLLENFIAQYLILSYSPFKEGDSISIGGITGRVMKVSSVYTEISSNGDRVYVPNSLLLRAAVTIPAASGLTKFTLPIKVGAPFVDEAERIILSIARENKELTIPPDPEVNVVSIDERSAELQLSVYVTNPKKGAAVASRILKDVQRAFFEKGIYERIDQEGNCPHRTG
ncbi:MAG: mechanosensitive ion channel [Candidatus Bathyarchaeia archaeon]